MKFFKIITLIAFLFIEMQQQVMGVNITLLQILAGILFLVILIKSFLDKKKLKDIIKDKKLFICYLIYIAILFILIVYHNTNSIFSIAKYTMTLIAGLIIYFDFYFQDYDEDSYKSYLLVLLLMSAFIIIYGLFTTPDVIAGPKRFDSIFWGRSNRMASRFLLLFPSAFFLSKYKSNLYYILFYILVLGMIMTVSRGGILVLGFFVIANIKEFIKKKNLVKTISGFSICLLISYKFNYLQSLFYRSDVLKTQIQQQAAGAGTGISDSISRVILWRKAYEYFTSNPLFGIGIDKYRTYYMYYGEKVCEVNAHNWVLHLMAEVGIIGLIGTLLLIVAFAYILYSNYMKYRYLGPCSNIMIKLKIGIWTFGLYLIHNMEEASANSLMFGYGNVSALLLVILGICIGNYKTVENRWHK